MSRSSARQFPKWFGGFEAVFRGRRLKQGGRLRHARQRFCPWLEELETRLVPAVPELTPSQVVNAYGINQINFGGVAGTGAGQTIAIIDPGDDSAMVNSTAANFNTSDLAIFDASTGLANPPSFKVVGETGGARPTYGSSTIATATEAGSTVTITTTAAHGFSLNESVAISGVGVSGYNGTFRITSLTATTFTYTDSNTGLANSSGGTATAQNPVDTGETALDVEWAHAIAPQANIVLVEMTSGIFGDDVATAVATAEAAGASVVSMSFTFGEFGGETGASATSFDDGLFINSGVSFVASTGDTGEQAGYPAFSPNVLGVGATNLNLNPDGSYLSEEGWSNPPVITSATESGNVVTINTATATGLSVGNLTTISGVGVAGYNGTFVITSVASTTSISYIDTNTGLAASNGGKVFGSVFTDGNSGGSGGGISTVETTQPAYQQGTVTKVTQSTTNRTLPDVAFVGGTGTPVEEYDSFAGGFVPTGGTSLSAPCWAGLIAIADQGLAMRGQPVLNTSSTLQTALYDSPLAFFHDITVGFNGASAGPGYDLVTGIGTPKANLLIPSLAGFAPLDLTSPGAQTSLEGTYHTFALGSYTDYGAGPVKYDVSWGDGTADLVGTSASTSGSLSAAHTYSEQGTYTLKLTVTDETTGQVASYTITITVTDRPVVATGVPVFGVENRPLTAPMATFTDPGGAEPNPYAPTGTINTYYSASINWGDGTTSPATLSYAGTPGSKTAPFTVSGTHAYTHTGTFVITTTINHEGLITVTSSIATITDDIGLLLLDPTGNGALQATNNGQVNVNGFGGVIVNSTSSTAVNLSGNAVVTADDIDVTGGVRLLNNSSISVPSERQPPLADPLGLKLPATLPTPIFRAVSITSAFDILTPGTYVGGIHVSGGSFVILEPGTYYMQGGGFMVDSSEVIGGGVTIINTLTNPNGAIRISGNSFVELSAPVSGPFQGVVLFQDAGSTTPLFFLGQSETILTGVVYAPAALVNIESSAQVTIDPGVGTAVAPPPLFGALIARDLLVENFGVLTINPDDPPAPLSSPAVVPAASSANGNGGGVQVPSASSSGGPASSASTTPSAPGSSGSTTPVLPPLSSVLGSSQSLLGSAPSLPASVPSTASTSAAYTAMVDQLFLSDWQGGNLSSGTNRSLPLSSE